MALADRWCTCEEAHIKTTREVANQYRCQCIGFNESQDRARKSDYFLKCHDSFYNKPCVELFHPMASVATWIRLKLRKGTVIIMHPEQAKSARHFAAASPRRRVGSPFLETVTKYLYTSTVAAPRLRRVVKDLVRYLRGGAAFAQHSRLRIRPSRGEFHFYSKCVVHSSSCSSGR